MTDPIVNEIIAEQRPIEREMARSMTRRGRYVVPVLVAIFGLTRGGGGAVAAGVGGLVVVGNYLLTGEILARSARISLPAYYAGAVFGYFLRLGLIAGTLLLIANLFEVDRFALGLSVVATYMTLLTWEAIAMSKRRT